MEKTTSISKSLGLPFFGLQSAILIVGWTLMVFLKTPIDWSIDPNQMALTIIFSLPLLLLAVLVTSPVGLGIDFVKTIFNRILESPLGPFIQEGGPWKFLLISVLAGLGEELVFRGVLQEKGGLVLAAVLFGLFHFVSFAYFAVATFLGIYLGSVYIWTGHHFLSPVIIHVLYDFVFLILMRRACQ